MKRGSGGGYDYNLLYPCMNFSKNKLEKEKAVGSIGLCCPPSSASRAGITGMHYQAQLSIGFVIREVAII